MAQYILKAFLYFLVILIAWGLWWVLLISVCEDTLGASILWVFSVSLFLGVLEGLIPYK